MEGCLNPSVGWDGPLLNLGRAKLITSYWILWISLFNDVQILSHQRHRSPLRIKPPLAMIRRIMYSLFSSSFDMYGLTECNFETTVNIILLNYTHYSGWLQKRLRLFYKKIWMFKTINLKRLDMLWIGNPCLIPEKCGNYEWSILKRILVISVKTVPRRMAQEIYINAAPCSNVVPSGNTQLP